jgi:hypothetical protein
MNAHFAVDDNQRPPSLEFAKGIQREFFRQKPLLVWCQCLGAGMQASSKSPVAQPIS